MTGASSTKKPVKIATKTVKSFLKDVSSIKKDYEFAIMNYLSYHMLIKHGKNKR
jgi:hypothetical protein